MSDVTFYIPEWEEAVFDAEPPCPENEMPRQERERLDQEFDEQLVAGAFDLTNEVVEL